MSRHLTREPVRFASNGFSKVIIHCFVQLT